MWVKFGMEEGTKSFSDFDLVWCVGRPRPHMRTNVTLTRSKVKFKVTQLPKLGKLHLSSSISSAVLACNSKLTVVDDSMGPGLQLVGARFVHRAQCSHCKRCISYSNSVCPSVRPSVTRRYCVKTTARSTMQFSPLDSKMCLVL